MLTTTRLDNSFNKGKLWSNKWNHITKPNLGVVASSVSVQHFHTEFPALGSIGKRRESRIRNMQHDARPEETLRQPAAWISQVQQGGDPVAINSLQAVGEGNIDTIVEQFRRVQNVVTALSSEQRATRQQGTS